jgi:hypothetical protein
MLLTHDMFRQISNISRVPLKSFPGRFGVYEYLWTAEDKLDLLDSEPQLTFSVLSSAASERSVSKEPASREPAILTSRNHLASDTLTLPGTRSGDEGATICATASRPGWFQTASI